MPSHIEYTKTKNNVIYFQSFDNTYLSLTWLSHLIQTYMSWLQPRKRGLHFILNNNDNYNFDIKVGRCGFMDFVNNVIDYGCLGYVFYFKIKEKEKDIFYINFYSIIFLQSFYFYFYFYFSLLQLDYYIGYVCAICNCYFL